MNKFKTTCEDRQIILKNALCVSPSSQKNIIGSQVESPSGVIDGVPGALQLNG